MPPTTITDVRTIGVTVSDQDRALDFYVGTLGFEKRMDAPISGTMRWIEVAPPGAGVSLAINGAEDDAVTGADTGIRFTVPDAASEHAAMHERGVDRGDEFERRPVKPLEAVR